MELYAKIVDDQDDQVPGEVLHLPHGGDSVPWLPLPHQSRNTIHSQIIEHPVVSSRHHLIRSGGSELSHVFPVVIDTTGVDQDGVGIKQCVTGVDLILQFVDWENNVLKHLSM